MISSDELREIANKLETVPANVHRDYLQTLFLFGFYQQKNSSLFFFKGGTALHLLFKSPRFSEDLDFSTHSYNCQLFEKLLTNSLEFIEKNGFKVDFIESKPTTGGCLAIFSAVISLTPVKIQLEVSLRNPKQMSGETALLTSLFLPPFNVQIIKEEELTAGKINALLTRAKPRDFYDLYFILRAGLKVNLSEKERTDIIKKADALKQEDLTKDLKEFLPKSHRSIIKDLPQILKNELGRN